MTLAFAGSIDGIDEGQRFSPKRIVAAAVIGGTSSSITGGKFSNGAVTGAFSRAFNDENHTQAEACAQKRCAGQMCRGARKSDPHAGHDHSGPGGNPNPDGITLDQMEEGYGTWGRNHQDRYHNLDENGDYDPSIGNQKWQDTHGHEEVFDVDRNPVRNHNGPTFNRFPGNLNPLHLYDIYHWERNGTGWPDDHTTRESRCAILC